MRRNRRNLSFFVIPIFFAALIGCGDGHGAAADDAAKLAQPVNWGSPDQPYGKRRPVTAADRAAIQRYRSGGRRPIFATNFNDPAELRADWILMSDDSGMCRRPANVETSSAGLRLKTLAAAPDWGGERSSLTISRQDSMTMGSFGLPLR